MNGMTMEAVATRATVDGYALSVQQRHLWERVRSRGGRGGCAWLAVEIGGGVDAALLRVAVDAVVDRYEILRTRVVHAPELNAPLQVIGAARVEWAADADWSGLAGEEVGIRLQRQALAALRHPLDLDGEPLLHASLARIRGGAHLLLLRLPALVADESTLRELPAAIGRAYAALPGLEGGRLNVTRLVVRAPDGTERTERVPGDVYREIVAASGFKQRVRTMLAYHHADRLHYAVVGTPNRLEYDQGFFVKGGDGLADLKPIAHLYKTQVYALARYLGVPDAVLTRPPTTDTYSLPQTQEEFYFALPAATLDVLLHARNRGLAPVEAALRAGVRPPQAAAAYEDIARKRAATRPLHVTSLLVEPVPEVGGGEGTG